jgi:hypothetical protein
VLPRSAGDLGCGTDVGGLVDLHLGLQQHLQAAEAPSAAAMACVVPLELALLTPASACATLRSASASPLGRALAADVVACSPLIHSGLGTQQVQVVAGSVQWDNCSAAVVVVVVVNTVPCHSVNARACTNARCVKPM